jgi:hypothetical protein
MPISDYASAHFFSHHHRVTLDLLTRGLMCGASRRLLFLKARVVKRHIDGAAAHTGVSAIEVSGEAKLHQNTGAKNCLISLSMEQYAYKRKSPALPGFFDEYLFRSVHFASLAI